MKHAVSIETTLVMARISLLLLRASTFHCGRHSTLRCREQSVFNQTNIGTVSRATLERLLRGGAERLWSFPSATMPSCAETETEVKPRKWIGVWLCVACIYAEQKYCLSTISQTKLLTDIVTFQSNTKYSFHGVGVNLFIIDPPRLHRTDTTLFESKRITLFITTFHLAAAHWCHRV